MYFSNPDCVQTKGDHLRTEAFPTDRRLVWATHDRETVRLGIIPAKDTHIYRPDTGREIPLQIPMPKSRTLDRVLIRVAATESDPGWRWVWKGSDIFTRRTLILPAKGRFIIEISSKGFKTIRQVVEPAKQLAALNLSPLPEISVHVVTPDDRPAIATVTAGARTAAVDAGGNLSIAVDGDWPEMLTIDSPGFARRVVDVPKTVADVDLGTVRLVKGGSIAVSIESERAGEVTRAELLRANRVLRNMEKRPIVFEGVEPGRYQVRLRGKEPLQVFVEPVRVEEGRVAELPIHFAPHSMTLTTFLGNDKLPDASVSLRSIEFTWDAALKTDSDGRAVAEIWQPGGQFMISATSPAVERPYADFMKIEDVRDPDVVFRLPNNTVKGIVVDDDGNPVGTAEVFLQTTRGGDVATTITAKSDGSGRFIYRAVAAGHQSIGARADGFLDTDGVEFDLKDGDAERDVSVRLKRGLERKIIVVDADGAPIADAVVAEGSAGHFLGFRPTDASGRLSLQIRKDEQRTLYVIPRQGSLAVANLGGDGEVRVVVPRPLGSLNVTTQTKAGTAAPNIWFLVRYNGEILPLEVLQLMDRVQGLKFFTGPAGACRLTNLPLGTYDLWPVLGGREAQEIADSRPSAAPVRVALAPGENSAILTFTPR